MYAHAGAGFESGVTRIMREAKRTAWYLPAMTALSVNVNKIAVLRNSRGGATPDVLRAARTALAAGCAGITVHPRPDARHIRTRDVLALAALRQSHWELNIEGNPFAGARGEYPGLLALAQAARPAQVTLVPDDDGQLTSDHGFVPQRDHPLLAPIVSSLHALGARVSVFVDADCGPLQPLAAIGVDRIELYTGPYAAAFAAGSADRELRRYRDCAMTARACGLQVNAGHDLDQANLGSFLSSVGDVAEVSIGHALISEALYDGLERTVRNYLAIIASVRGSQT